jgi:hypothetical protein
MNENGSKSIQMSPLIHTIICCSVGLFLTDGKKLLFCLLVIFTNLYI